MTDEELKAFWLLIVVIFFVIALSLACSITKNGFSMNTLLTSLAIGILVLIWIPMISEFFIVIPILLIVAMLFSDRGDNDLNE